MSEPSRRRSNGYAVVIALAAAAAAPVVVVVVVVVVFGGSSNRRGGITRNLLTTYSPDLHTVPSRQVDIAGLAKGASRGEGLGNKFLGTVRS